MRVSRLFWLPLFGATLVSPAFAGLSPVEVIQKIESHLAPKKVHATYQFKNTRTDGTITEYEISFRIMDINHSHGSFMKPEREKGREVLRQGETLWSYMPSVGRAVRIADRDSFAGGDFSNADILRVDWTRQYTPTLAKETPKQWIFDLTAKVPDAAYAKMRLWVDKATVQPVQQHFFDSRDNHLKTCLYGSVKDFGPVTRPSRARMENLVTHQLSELTILELVKEEGMKESRFVVENLGK